MISYRDITAGLNELGLNRSTPLVAHMDMTRLGNVKGGVKTAVGALLATVDNLIMPAFTYSTLVIPESGPPDNDMDYGSGRASNLQAAIFRHDLPVDWGEKEAVEELRKYPDIYRSSHPVFSFIGLGMDVALINHPPEDPYAPLKKARELNSHVLLLGTEPSVNFSIHWAEMLTGRRQFTRWALTANGIQEIPHFPGCPNGFHKLTYYLQEELRSTKVGDCEWQAVRLDTLIETAAALIKDDAFALLCNDIYCKRCNIVRGAIKAQYARQWRAEA
jgi:aminoglycoside 3-N-acetyltransferase